MDLDNKNILALYYSRQNTSHSVLSEAKESEEKKESSLLSKVAWYIAEIVDPTGILSWDDLGLAINRFKKDPDMWTAGGVVLALYCCIPSIAPVAAAAATGAATGAAAGAATGGAVGALGAGVGAAPGAGIGAGIGAGGGALASGGTAYFIWSIAKGIAKIGPRVFKIPGAKKAFRKVLDSVKEAFKNSGVIKAGQSLLDTLASKGIISKEKYETIKTAFEKLEIKWPFTWRPALPSWRKGAARGMQGAYNRTMQTKEELFGQQGSYKQYAPSTTTPMIPGAAGAAATGTAASTSSQGNPYDTVTVQGPRGPIQTTRMAAQQAGLTPIEDTDLGSQQPQVMYSFGGRLLTPAQAAALGPLAQPVVRTGRGEVVPLNVPQGATPQQPMGREGSTPQQYMRPDRFNNPPTSFFGNQPMYGTYAQSPYGYQQPSGIAGAIGNTGDMMGSLLGGMGAMTGQMAGTPVAALANMAGGLLGILPGMGSVGSTQMGMLPYMQGV